MKAKALLLSAIILHFLVRTFWNFHIVIPDYISPEQQTNLYMLGISIVFLLWAYSYKERNLYSVTEKTQRHLKIITNTWLIFISGDVLKEASRTTGYLQDLFFNPTNKNMLEYLIWAIAIIYVWYKLRK